MFRALRRESVASATVSKKFPGPTFQAEAATTRSASEDAAVVEGVAGEVAAAAVGTFQLDRPGVNIIKLFFSSSMTAHKNKLGYL